MPHDDSHEFVTAVAAEIMAYLNEHTDAGDTASGIQQWWLRATRARADLGSVDCALQGLTASGRIGMRVLASGERFYFRLSDQPGERA